MTSLSVIIPIYNAEKYLSQTIESVLEQSLKDIELICVDDGSTDASCEIIKGYMKKDKRVKLLQQKNSHAGVARNYGLSEATGEYVHFLDADDYCLKYGYESVVAKAKNRDLDCLKFCAVPYDEDRKITVANDLYTMDNIGEGDFLRLLTPQKDEVLYHLSVAPWSGIYRRKYLIDNNIRFNDLICVNDRSFYVKVITSADRMMISKDWVLVHRINMSDSLVGKRAQHFDCQERSIQIIEKQMLEDEVEDRVFSDVLRAEFTELLVWAVKFHSDKHYGDAIVKCTEHICEEYAHKYNFLRDIRKDIRILRNKHEQNARAGSNDKGGSTGTAPEEGKCFYERCKHPKVSVVVPVFNQEEYLNVALNSLARQTLKEIEFICVNDGSTDSSMTIIRQFADIDKRFIIIDKKNTGYGNSMNVGIDAAKGEYLGILEPDDFVAQEMFGDLYKIAKRNDLDWVKADFNRFWVMDDGAIKKKRFRLSRDRSYYNRIIKPLDEKESFHFVMNTWSGIYKLDFLNKWHIRHNETPGASYQDNGFWFQTFCKAERGWFTSGPYYMNRRDNPNSSMFNKGKADAITKEYNFIYQWMAKDPVLLAEVESIFYDRKLANALFTYYRLAAEWKRAYLYHIKDEFEGPLKDGKLQGAYVKKESVAILKEIIEDPDAFYDKIRVSVIIPAYNAEKYIRQCLDSILVRDEIRTEVICVDDGSTDKTLEILKEYEEKDYRVKVITQQNTGAGAARNKGMKHAHGECLLFLDADDFFDPEMIRRAYFKYYEEKCDIVVFGSDQYIESKQEYRKNNSAIKSSLIPREQPFTADQIKDNVFYAFVGWPWDKLFRAEFIKENGLKFQNQRTTNDLLFVFSAIVRAQSICTMERVLAHHRRLDDGESLSVSREKSWDCFYNALCGLRDQLYEWDLYDRYKRDFINYSLHFSLWNLTTLKGPAFFKLYDKLKNEWFDELGIIGKGKYYFYDDKDYRRLCDVMAMDAEEFVFALMNEIRGEAAEEREENRRLKAELKGTKKELNLTRNHLQKAQAKYEKVVSSRAYKTARKATYIYRKLKK